MSRGTLTGDHGARSPITSIARFPSAIGGVPCARRRSGWIPRESSPLTLGCSFASVLLVRHPAELRRSIVFAVTGERPGGGMGARWFSASPSEERIGTLLRLRERHVGKPVPTPHHIHDASRARLASWGARAYRPPLNQVRTLFLSVFNRLARSLRLLARPDSQLPQQAEGNRWDCALSPTRVVSARTVSNGEGEAQPLSPSNR
jgi:hypothetical protein